ncbi:MAG: ABC transporter substrate-binding protein [Rhodospirillaceae bacterium]
MNRRDFLAAGGAATLIPSALCAAERRYRIFIILFRGREDAFNGFCDYFAAHGLEVEFIVRDADRDISKIAGFVAEAKQLRPDLVYLWGTNATIEALGPWNAPDPARHLTDIPAVFNLVVEPVANGIIKSAEDTGRAATGTLFIAPIEAQLKALTGYRPARRIGVTFNPSERNSVLAVEALTRAAPGFNCDVIAMPLPPGRRPGEPNISAIPETVHNLKKAGADWLYIPSESFLIVYRDTLTGAALAERLPAFCASEPYIRGSNALFGLVCHYYSIGQFTAAKAERILRDGADPRHIPVETLSRFSLLINMRVAKELELYPPMNILRLAETV